MPDYQSKSYKAKEDPLKLAPPKPLLTGILLVLLIWSFADFTGHGWVWLKQHCFSCGKFVYQMEHGAFQQMLEMMFHSTFLNTSLAHLAGNAYFLWVFGSVTESRLGQLRYFALLIVCMFGGWLFLGKTMGAQTPYLYLSPALMTAGMIGAYLCFYPVKKINPGGSLGSEYRIFKTDPDPDPSEGFGVSPVFIMVAFVAYEVVMHFLLINNGIQKFDNMTLVATLLNFFAGLATALTLIMLSTLGTQGNPVKRLVIEKYRQLRALDMTHEDAISGTGRLLCIPPEQVKQWVAQGGSALHEKD